MSGLSNNFFSKEMSVENEQEIEEVIEKEISLAKGNKINSEGNALAEPKFQPKFILKMKVANL